MTELHNSVLVAVASKGDGQINQHFGHADKFYIYEVSPAGVRLVAARLVEHYCQGGYGDEEKREPILRALADCVACFVARIGDGPRAKLAEAGIEAVTDYPYSAIEPSVALWCRDYRDGNETVIAEDALPALVQDIIELLPHVQADAKTPSGGGNGG